MTIAIVHRPLPLIGRLSSPMAVVLQHCKGAGAAEDDDRRCHHGDRLLPIMWSIDSSLYSASRFVRKRRTESNDQCAALLTYTTSLAGIPAPISTYAEMPERRLLV